MSIRSESGDTVGSASGGIGGGGLGDPAVIQKRSQFQQSLDRGRRDRAMLVQHHALSGIVTAQQRADQQTVVLIQLLHGGVRRAMQLDETLLTAAAEQ